MSANHAKLNRWTWAEARKTRLTTAAARGERCYRCGGCIDYTLDGRTKWGPTADHITALEHGNPTPYDQAGIAPAHAHCNKSHGAALGNRARGKAHHPSQRTALTW